MAHLDEQQLEKLVDAFRGLNHLYLHHQGCNATVDGRFDCPSVKWAIKNAPIPGTAYLQPPSEENRELLSKDNEARRLAHAEGRSQAIKARDELLLRTFYAS